LKKDEASRACRAHAVALRWRVERIAPDFPRPWPTPAA
jgi:hypothetical protein